MTLYNRTMKRFLPIFGIVLFIVFFAAITALSHQKDSDAQTPRNSVAENTDERTSTPANTRCVGSLTTATTEGPYYVKNTKALIDGKLNYDNLPGATIKITGYVYQGSDNSTPLSNAYVDVWQADGNGKYWPAGNKDATTYTDKDLSLRGGVFADDNGYYELTTIYPGEYEGRARHIHFRVSSNDGSKSVTTQLIMSKPGDQTPASQDLVAKNLPACNTAQFDSANDEIPTTEFNFHL